MSNRTAPPVLRTSAQTPATTSTPAAPAKGAPEFLAHASGGHHEAVGGHRQRGVRLSPQHIPNHPDGYNPQDDRDDLLETSGGQPCVGEA